MYNFHTVHFRQNSQIKLTVYAVVLYRAKPMNQNHDKLYIALMEQVNTNVECF